MTVDPALREKTLQKLRERAAKDGVDLAVHRGSEVVDVERIPTGSPMLDYATCGGIPIGRWTRFWGGTSSGKSLTAWNVIREAQRMGMTVCYYNIEKQYEPDFTARTGVDIEALEVIDSSTIEDIGEALESLLGVHHVHVLDSCSEGVSLQELATDYGDSAAMASKARAWAQVFLKCMRHFDATENVIIYLDQVRATFGRTHADQVHAPGGNLMEFRSSLTLFFKRGNWLFRDKDGKLVDKDNAAAGRSMSGRTEADGIEVVVKCDKNRVGRPFRQAIMRYDLDGAKLDVPWELAQAAVYLDQNGRPAHLNGTDPIFPRTTPNSHHYKLPDGTAVNGASALARRLEEDGKLRDHVRAAMKKGM